MSARKRGGGAKRLLAKKMKVFVVGGKVHVISTLIFHLGIIVESHSKAYPPPQVFSPLKTILICFLGTRAFEFLPETVL